MTKNCQQCGKEFGPGQWPQNFKTKKFCSKECMGASYRLSFEERLTAFWSRVDKQGPGGCWLYTGGKKYNGYGLVNIRGRMLQAHRFVWTLLNGEIAKGLCVLHRCDVPACVNPEHLFTGTKKDNSLDAMRKGRNTRGEKNMHAKLTEEQVIEILRNPPKRGRTKDNQVPEYAERYGVDRGTIEAILAGRSWKYLHGSYR